MRIFELRTLNGRNVHTHRPALRFLVDLEGLAGKESCDIKGFSARLLRILPGLAGHGCASGGDGGFKTRLYEGTFFGHVLEHVILEIQALLGLQANYGKTRATNQLGVYEIVLECQALTIADMLVEVGVAVVTAAVQDTAYDLVAALEHLRREAGRRELGPSTQALASAAQQRGISVHRIGEGSLLQLGTGCLAKRVQATLTSDTSCIGTDIAGNKALTKQILSAAGIPTPRGYVVYTPEEAVEAFRKINCSVVVKPLDGNQGKGVTLNLNSEGEIASAFAIAAHYSSKVLVEEYVEGRHYRLLLVRGQVLAASERIPAHVIGNGRASIMELIDQVNQDPQRGYGHEKPLTRISVDDVVRVVLMRQGYQLESVPAPGQRVWLRENANLSTGGTAIDVTDHVHPSVKESAIRAVRLIGLDVAGIDMVLQDISQPMSGGVGAVIEVNAAPGIRMHHYPVQGASRDVAGAIIDALFPEGEPSEIPIVAITGTNGKTTTSRLVAHVLRQCYQTVGLTTTDGIFLNDQLIVQGDTTGPWSTRVVLNDPTVEAAVLELARGGLLRAGIGYEQSDVGVLTNISEDHLGQDNLETMDDLVWAKSLVLEAVKPDGYVVINADDPHSHLALERMNSQKVIFFSLGKSQLVRRHLGVGGKAVLVANGQLCLAEGSECTPLMAISEIPICFDGHARHNVANAAAACAALIGLGIEPELIRKGFASFMPNAQDNPGRQNLFTIGECTVMVDYAHNVASVNETVALARHLRQGQLIGVICVPGDRRSATIYKVGQAAGQGFDRLIIKEDQDRRGRAPGEVAEVVRQGAIAGGIDPERIAVLLNEADALRAGISIAQPGDMVVVLYEKLELTMSLLEQLAREMQQAKKTYVVAGTGTTLSP